MFSTKKYRSLRSAVAARFLVGVAALLVLAAPALAQFNDGDYCTYTQGGWGAVPQGNNPGTILHNGFDLVYGSSGVFLGLSGHSMSFKDTTSPAVEGGADAITAYLPAGGKPKPLGTGDLINPATTASGVFGGQVLALQLNVDFADARIIIGNISVPVFGDLVINGTGTSFDGLTVRQLLAAANQALGTPTTLPANLNDLVSNLNQGFDNCGLNTWALQHLAVPPPQIG